MPKITALFAILAVALALSLPAGPCEAQLSRTFVSAAFGNDANNCDRPTPCRTFQGAHDKTHSDGEIIVLDPGGYGALSVTKSISIVNDGVGEASILVSGGATGIAINAGGAGYVNLRGLTIQGIGFGGSTGLRLDNAFALTITNCVVRNNNSDGIVYQPSLNGTANLALSHTLVADNGGSGINIQPSGTGRANVILNHVESYHNSAQGVVVSGLSTTVGSLVSAVAVHSVVAGNLHAGFVTSSSAGTGQPSLLVFDSVCSNNSLAGFHNDTGGSISVAVGGSTVGPNGSGGIDDPAHAETFGDNYTAGVTGPLASFTLSKQ